MANLFSASLPLIVFTILLILKRGPIVSSIVGILTVSFVIYFYDSYFNINLDILITHDIPMILMLTLSVALVIFPGQIMNSLLKQAGTIREIGKSIESIEIPKLRLASIIVLGVAPALESLTGFGVSLFFTVPLLMQFFKLRKALILSLLSMNIMPWGTLALATLIGSQITELSFTELSYQTSLLSFFVFPMIGFLLYFTCREDSAVRLSQLLYPVIAGFFLSCFLVVYNLYAASELAGVYSGMSVVILCFIIEFMFNKNVFSNLKYSKKSIFLSFCPYIILVFLIALSRIETINNYLLDVAVVKSGDISFSILTSPGVFISLTIIVLYAFSKKYRSNHTFFFDGLKKALYPVAGIFLFVTFAQIQRSSGILEALTAKSSDLSLLGNTFLSPLIGMMSGYTMGSNVGGNVLFILLQSDIGSHFDEKLLFAAIQNSSAGHAVFMSIPIILLTFSIAQINAEERTLQRNWLIRRTLWFAPCIYFSVTASAYLATMKLW